MTKASADLRSLARSHTEAALETLVAIMQADDATPAARISAANSFLERGWGERRRVSLHPRVSFR